MPQGHGNEDERRNEAWFILTSVMHLFAFIAVLSLEQSFDYERLSFDESFAAHDNELTN